MSGLTLLDQVRDLVSVDGVPATVLRAGGERARVRVDREALRRVEHLDDRESPRPTAAVT